MNRLMEHLKGRLMKWNQEDAIDEQADKAKQCERKLLSRIPNQKGLGCPFHGQFKKQSTKHMETIQTTEEEAKAAMLLPKHDQKTIPFFWTFCGEIS